MAKLSVNVDHVATLREARKACEPDPVAAAIAAELAGADGITVHLRGDRRHIKDRDLRILREVIKTSLTLEMAATDELVEKAIEIKPNLATLVPEKPEEITTEGGLNLEENIEALSHPLSKLQVNGILVSLFINPDLESVKLAAKLRADYVEINTDKYANAKNLSEEIKELENIEKVVGLANKLNLGINAGHGLNYRNVSNLVLLEHIEEFSIGHSIIARAVLVGMEKAVQEMLRLVKK
jgi:pyridoxine 5-phosphate synthase